MYRQDVRQLLYWRTVTLRAPEVIKSRSSNFLTIPVANVTEINNVQKLIFRNVYNLL